MRLGVETGNMLIMTYAYARASGDGSLISRYVCQTMLVVSIEDSITSLVLIADVLGRFFVKFIG